jgi:CBS domain containing-hemolysin-like protein
MTGLKTRAFGDPPIQRRQPHLRLLVLIVAALSIWPPFAWAVEAAPSTPVDANYNSSDVTLLVAYMLLALVVSFLCSIAEAVLLSITPAYIAGLAVTHPRRADLLRRLKQDDVDQSLAAILTLNTIAHTVGAIGSGAKATAVFGSAWFGLFSAVMTLLILFLSEIIPKTLGAVHWRRLAGPTAIFVRGLILLLYPMIFVSQWLTRLISGGKPAHAFNRDEFIAMAGVGEQSGKIDEQESDILRNLFKLESLKTEDVMTPRTVIVGFGQDQTVDDVLEANRPFSRLPIYETDLDNVVGFVLKDEVLLSKADGLGDAKLRSFNRPIATVPGQMGLATLLELLIEQRQHIALVVNEYGGTQGLVTLEDVVETLLGKEIVDEMDTTEDMQALARQQWARRAAALGLDVEADAKRDEPTADQ